MSRLPHFQVHTKKYPKISKIVFYINKEPGMSTEDGKEKPEYIRNVENHGDSFGIEVEWRGISQIETMLMRPEMRYIRDYFFCANGGIRQFTAQVEQHKAAVFDSIASEIPYGEKSIKIKRDMLGLDSFLPQRRMYFCFMGMVVPESRGL